VKSVAPLAPERLHRDAITDREIRAPSAGSRSRDGTPVDVVVTSAEPASVVYVSSTAERIVTVFGL
jgi:hypothetical protein